MAIFLTRVLHRALKKNCKNFLKSIKTFTQFKNRKIKKKKQRRTTTEISRKQLLSNFVKNRNFLNFFFVIGLQNKFLSLLRIHHLFGVILILWNPVEGVDRLIERRAVHCFHSEENENSRDEKKNKYGGIMPSKQKRDNHHLFVVACVPNFAEGRVKDEAHLPKPRSLFVERERT